MDKNGNKKSPKIAKIYICEKCDYKCSKNSDYVKHLMTLKHINGKHGNINDNGKITIEEKIFICDCGKEYKHSSGLSRHKQKCNYKQTIDSIN